MPALISLVVPLFNEEQCLPALSHELAGLAGRIEGEKQLRVEIVLVDDGSRDRSWFSIVEFAQGDSRVRGVSLSRNFGHQAALTCGYELAAGDAVVTLDADLQDPPEVVLELIDTWRQGADIVYAVREYRQGESLFKRWSADLFYRLLHRIGETNAPRDAGDFRLMSRRAVDALNDMQEAHRYVRGMVGWLGFRTAVVRYRRAPRAAGRTKYSVFGMIRLAVGAIVSFSTLPLRLFYWAAAICTIPFGLYATYALYQWYTRDVPLQPGWMALMMSIIAFGCLNLISLGIMGEYVGRIYEQSKRRPHFLIREQVNFEESDAHRASTS
jgi:glycosyltransferase involved in cell wall biosynthesis